MTTTTDERTPMLTEVNRRAKRCQCIVGNEEHPSEWDAAHALLDALLVDWEDAPHG